MLDVGVYCNVLDSGWFYYDVCLEMGFWLGVYGEGFE